MPLKTKRKNILLQFLQNAIIFKVRLNPGRKGKALGIFDIYLDIGKKKEDSNFKLLTLTERIPDSPRMTEMLLLYKQMLAAENLTDDVQQVPLTAG